MNRVTRSLARLACPVLMAATVACGSGQEPRPAPAAGPRSAGTPAAVAQSLRPRVVVLGDSLTAGLGLGPGQSYPTLLQQKIDAEGLKYDVTNAGVSGDTSAGGLSRLDWALDADARVLIIALGANDGLRGLSVDELSRNLSTIIERAQARRIVVILAGMEAPPNFGQEYTALFRQVYPDLAKKYDVAFVPFLLQDVAGVDTLNQRDGIHPSADGARIVADTVWAVLRPVLTTS